jgi:hypothetical protein
MICLVISGCNHAKDANKSVPGAADSGTDARQSALSKPAENVQSDASASDGFSGFVALDAITLVAPPEWKRVAAGSSLVAAEFALPRAEGDDADGRLTISTAGGSVEANIDRWKGQFVPQPEQASQKEVDVAGLTVTIVDLSGEFNDQRGPFAPGERRPGYRMIAAIVPVNAQLYFIKATGPQKTIASHAEVIDQFIRSARLKN